MGTIATIYTVAADEPPYPSKPPYPAEPEYPEPVKELGFARNYRKSAAYFWAMLGWDRKRRSIDEAYAKVVREWVYATDIDVDAVLPLPRLLKALETGEVVLVDAHGAWHRGWGAGQASLMRRGMKLLDMGLPYSTGASLR